MATPFIYTDLCKEVEFQAMAQDIATLGYQEPKFSWQMPCKYVALDVNTPTDTRSGDHPVIHSTIDFRSQIKAAWPVLLDQLQQAEIPIPDIARQPILPGINDQCRNRVRPDGLEVNCWVKEGTEAAEGKIALGGYIVYPLAEPLFIPFENPVNLSLGELSKYTFIGAHDINDQPMYDLQTHFPYGDAPENADGHHHFLLCRWNKQWLRTHQEFPMTAITTFDGIGFVANYDSAFTDHFLLLDVVKQLKDKGIIS